MRSARGVRVRGMRRACAWRTGDMDEQKTWEQNSRGGGASARACSTVLPQTVLALVYWRWCDGATTENTQRRLLGRSITPKMLCVFVFRFRAAVAVRRRAVARHKANKKKRTTDGRTGGRGCPHCCPQNPHKIIIAQNGPYNWAARTAPSGYFGSRAAGSASSRSTARRASARHRARRTRREWPRATRRRRSVQSTPCVLSWRCCTAETSAEPLCRAFPHSRGRRLQSFAVLWQCWQVCVVATPTPSQSGNSRFCSRPRRKKKKKKNAR